MDLWSGSIPTGSLDLDIRLVNATPKRDHIISSKSRLSFHSFVNPALIPLYARAGPSVEVHTANVESAEWLKTKLLGSLWLEEWGDDPDDENMERAGVEIQCPVALLLTVDSSQAVGDNTTNTNNVSDLLVYGILTASNSNSNSNQDRLPSPAGSAPGDGNQPAESSRKRELRIYAAPLATSYVQKAQDLPSPPSSPIEGDNNKRSCGEDGLVAQFLPDLRSPTPKRKRMLSIFETAAQHHRRVRQYGGQAVSQLMATTKSQTHQTQQPLKIKREPTDDGANKPGLDRLGGLRRARSLSIGGSQLARLDNTRGVGTDENRPSSSKGLQQQTRRMISKNDGGASSHSFNEFERSRSIAPTSNLASYNEAAIDNHDPSTLLLSSSPTTGETLVACNKDVITRAILTGMRLYGYHRKPNRAASRPATIVSELDGIGEDGAITPTLAEDFSKQSTTTTTTTDEDDFKAMYHATYKAATFALRHYLKTDTISNNNDNNRNSTKGTGPAVLSRNTATNVIDEILKLFCDDQLKAAG